MATSTGTLTAQGVIRFAARQLGAVPVGESPSEAESMAMLADLNVMLKEWQADGVQVFRISDGSVPLQKNVYSYSLAVDNPLRIYEMRYRNSSGLDVPMTELTRTRYKQLPQKTSPGIPLQYFADYQEAGTTLYVWGVPNWNITSESFQYSFVRRFQVCQYLTDGLDVEESWEATVGWNLAMRDIPAYGPDEATAQRIERNATVLYQKAKDFNRPRSVQFVPAGRNRR